MSEPWMKFYPTDWRADPALRMCSLAARGLWIEMLGLMHEAIPYGHFLVSGQSPTDTQLAVLVGAPPEQIPALIGELEAAGVFSRTREGVIYSRKMTRASKKAAIARKNGKNGGNPSLCNKKGNPPSDNRQDKGEDKPQKPEARSQNIDTNVSSSASADFERFWAVYPKKVEKKSAQSKFSAAIKRGVDPESIIAGAEAYSHSETVSRGFVKHPTTWLNAGCWDDEPAASPTHSQQSAPQTDRDRRKAFLRRVAGKSA